MVSLVYQGYGYFVLIHAAFLWRTVAMSGSWDNTCQFSLRISHQVANLQKSRSRQMGRVTFHSPWNCLWPMEDRCERNVAHANTKRLCGSILHGDVGALLRAQPSLSATFCLLVERQYHAAASIAGMDLCAAVASPFLYLISSPLYLSLTITTVLRCQCIFLRTITWVLGFLPSPFPWSLVRWCLSAW